MSEQVSIEQQGARAPHDWKKTRRMVGGIVILVVTTYAGVVSGKFIAGLIEDANVKTVLGVPLAWGVAGIGLTYIVSSIEKLLELLQTLWDYVTKPDLEVSLYPGCATLACLVAYLTALPTVFSVAPESEPAPAAISKEVVYLARAPERDPRPVEAFSFQFGFARGTPPNWAKGVKLDEGQDAALARLLRSLQACVGSNPGQNVEIQVVGFADANEFPSNSDDFNREAANRRAANLHKQVVAIVGAQKSKARLIVRDPVQWTSFKQMTEHPRYFRARPLRQTGKGHDQGLLNRRADILLLRAGVCERLVAK
jgi:hypothetical protein